MYYHHAQQYYHHARYAQFPHLITTDVIHAFNMRLCAHDWLEAHVGKRDVSWCHPTSNTFRFKHESDAITFSLTWS